ncbi:MAG: hypothetical protein ABIN79_13210 [Marmoricola sp.]
MKPVRYTGTFLALVALAGFVVLTLARLFTPSGRVWVLATSFVPFALLACVGAAMVSLLVRWIGRRTARNGQCAACARAGRQRAAPRLAASGVRRTAW